MNLLSFRNLGQPDGPFYDAKYKNPNDNAFVKAIAKDYNVADIDTETGDVVQRPATPADRFPNPYPNEYAARAGNGGALPPDLSIITKAREGGPAYIYSLLTGYRDAPQGLEVPAGKHYNPYMPGDLSGFWKGDKDKVPAGGFIAMAPPLTADKVSFDDGTKSTLEQQAKDVVAFLDWAAEPKAGERKRTGFAVLIYLVLFAGLLYASYRRVWKGVKH
jgi:ubiquinol-cytochrome c reductase cytochrome c1 subunit